jgi:PBP1b-binding outer membrane lipoprotein LpoB
MKRFATLIGLMISAVVLSGCASKNTDTVATVPAVHQDFKGEVGGKK